LAFIERGRGEGAGRRRNGWSASTPLMAFMEVLNGGREKRKYGGRRDVGGLVPG
jgi:hypothetical protein